MKVNTDDIILNINNISVKMITKIIDLLARVSWDSQLPRSERGKPRTWKFFGDFKREKEKYF